MDTYKALDFVLALNNDNVNLFDETMFNLVFRCWTIQSDNDGDIHSSVAPVRGRGRGHGAGLGYGREEE